MRKLLAPKGVARSPFPSAPAILAGDLIFLGGTMATDWETGVDPEYRGVDDFRYDMPAIARQTYGIYETTKKLVEAGGSGLAEMVRVDQFTPRHDQFRHYLPVRDQYITKDRPASTAIAIKDLLVPGIMMQLDGMFIVPKPGFTKVAINSEKAPKPRAGYSLAIKAGDWIWCAGASPTDFQSRAAYYGALGHSQPEDVVVDPNFWYGSEIKNQARYDLHKLELYLEASNSDLQHVVKAQVYLTDPTDLGGLMEVWKETWPENPPATSVVLIDKMGIGGSRCEINMIALDKDSKIPVEVIKTNAAPQPHLHAPQAIKAGPYVFLSGRHAVNDSGIDPRAKAHSASPFIRSQGRDEMKVILEHTDAILNAAGGGLKDLVRVQVFTPDLNNIGPALGPWGKKFDHDTAPTLTVVGHTQLHVIPDTALSVDLTAYIP